MVKTDSPDKPLIVLVGPTASGKTSLALRLAEEFKGLDVPEDLLQREAKRIWDRKKSKNDGTAMMASIQRQLLSPPTLRRKKFE